MMKYLLIIFIGTCSFSNVFGQDSLAKRIRKRELHPDINSRNNDSGGIYSKSELSRMFDNELNKHVQELYSYYLDHTDQFANLHEYGKLDSHYSYYLQVYDSKINFTIFKNDNPNFTLISGSVIYVCLDSHHEPGAHTANTPTAMRDTVKKYHCKKVGIIIY